MDELTCIPSKTHSPAFSIADTNIRLSRIPGIDGGRWGFRIPAVQVVSRWSFTCWGFSRPRTAGKPILWVRARSTLFTFFRSNGARAPVDSSWRPSSKISAPSDSPKPPSGCSNRTRGRAASTKPQGFARMAERRRRITAARSSRKCATGGCLVASRSAANSGP